MIAIRDIFEESQRSPDFEQALYEGVKTVIESRLVSREAAYDELLELYQRLDADGRDKYRDAVADVMDRLIGWSAPSARI